MGSAHFTVLHLQMHLLNKYVHEIDHVFVTILVQILGWANGSNDMA